ncbi:MAG: DNA-binding transcriptional regulator [Bacteroidales bacterium]|nr:DNA-binding transcriptional regulator [Bacteroidales bacterium]
MVRLLFITDFTESFAYALLRGIIRYSNQSDEQWVVCRMPPAYKKTLGFKGVIKWAKKWGADAVIGQFEASDPVEQFRRNGIVAFAQDYKVKFDSIPNITGDYLETGRMAADLYLHKGFHHFAFFGYKDVCWSDERCEGFRRRIEEAGFGDQFYVYDKQMIDNLWYYEADELKNWLLSLPKPVAVMACDDNQGNALIEACNSAGVKIPSELSVIGVDNDEVICTLSNPTLSSIRVDIEQGGYETARMAVRMIHDPFYKGSDITLQPRRIVHRVSTSAYATSDKEVLTALQFIRQNLCKKITVSDVLEQVPLSRRLLEMRFKKVIGESIYQYISKQRIGRFSELLLETNDSIQEIAYQLGEDDPKSICRRFKELKGFTPSEWRNQKNAK